MVKSAGTGPGERHLLGPQTTGRTYRNLSRPQYPIRHQPNICIPMRDGVQLLADLHQPRVKHPVPALVAIAPYARQAQYLGLPAGMIEAGQTDFWVPRGYAHLIVNERGTCGSEGTYDFGSTAEHHDLYDVIEWVARQSWCDTNVGMIGVSYYAEEQLLAALEHPPHLKAIFPWSASTDWYRQVMWHGGMFSGRFMGMYFNALGMVSQRGGDFFRRLPFRLLNWALQRPGIHRRFALPPHDQLRAFNRALFLGYPVHPWDDIFTAVAVQHQYDDTYWQGRNCADRIGDIDIPLYLGADWDNVAVHLNTPFLALERLAATTPWRIGMTPRGALQWPWESLHVEALAWYDHWLKGQDTGILDGPPIRFFLGDAQGRGDWLATDTWPLPETRWQDLWLAADGTLAPSAPPAGTRDYLAMPPTLERGRNANPPILPTSLSWDTSRAPEEIVIVGPFVLHLEASSTASDTDWIVKLSDIAPDGQVRDLTQGWLRASHRAVDPDRSKSYRPFHPHDRAEPLTPGQPTTFLIEVLPTAHRLQPGHRLRLALTSDDRGDFAMQRLSHYLLGLPACNTILSTARLTVPVIAGTLTG
jgi:putative CocE/NonD family hydrolase